MPAPTSMSRQAAGRQPREPSIRKLEDEVLKVTWRWDERSYARGQCMSRSTRVERNSFSRCQAMSVRCAAAVQGRSGSGSILVNRAGASAACRLEPQLAARASAPPRPAQQRTSVGGARATGPRIRAGVPRTTHTRRERYTPCSRNSQLLKAADQALRPAPLRQTGGDERVEHVSRDDTASRSGRCPPGPVRHQSAILSITASASGSPPTSGDPQQIDAVERHQLAIFLLIERTPFARVSRSGATRKRDFEHAAPFATPRFLPLSRVRREHHDPVVVVQLEVRRISASGVCSDSGRLSIQQRLSRLRDTPRGLLLLETERIGMRSSSAPARLHLDVRSR